MWYTGWVGPDPYVAWPELLYQLWFWIGSDWPEPQRIQIGVEEQSLGLPYNYMLA